ncbi:MAG: class I SAM-dependent methyltransferase [Acidobacteriaceae bacterium]|nr:class I SAM-dependent methyltransferase [Acidobacteriaceae bacterium]MBV9444057.1 class I SAM-dependent methyltransferase [Acidobacteriaceae bacterium]
MSIQTIASALLEEKQTPSHLTRRVYDALAPVYGVSAQLFHSRAHTAAHRASGIEDGARVLEVGMGSGEMFGRLVTGNPGGQTFGVDLSPNMAARSQADVRRKFPEVAAQCQAADASRLPFARHSFDAVVCCFLFELLGDVQIEDSLLEIRRVLKPEGRLTLTLVGEKKRAFSAAYALASKVAPAFWGRQVDESLVNMLPSFGFNVVTDFYLRQLFYVSRVVSAVKTQR